MRIVVRALLAAAPLLAAVPARAGVPELGIVVVDNSHFDGTAVLDALCGGPDVPCAGVRYLDCDTGGCDDQEGATTVGSHPTNVATVLAHWLARHGRDGDKPVRIYSANGAGVFAWLAQAEQGTSRARARGIEVVVHTLGDAIAQSCPTSDPTYAYLAAQGVKIFWASGNNRRNGFVLGADGQLAQQVITCDQNVVNVGNLYNARVTRGGEICNPGDERECEVYPMHWKSNYKPGYVNVATNGCLPQLLDGTQPCTSAPRPGDGESGEIGTSYSAPAVAAAVAAISRRTGRGSHFSLLRLVAASPLESFTIQTDGPFKNQQVSYRNVSATSVTAALAAACPSPQAFWIENGAWYDPDRPGWGFGFNAHSNGVVSLVWYTYDAGGSPIWYTAQAPFNGCGPDWVAPVLRHRAGPSGVTARWVGSAGVHLLNARNGTFSFVLHDGWTHSGAEPVTYFEFAGPPNAVDGLWYDASSPGRGFHVASQGEVQVVTAYLFDTAGEPVWVQGVTSGWPSWFSIAPLTSYSGPGLHPGGSGPGPAQAYSEFGSFTFESSNGLNGYQITQLVGPLPGGRMLSFQSSSPIVRIQ